MVCQTAANDRLGLPCRLWLFLCPIEDTLLLSVSLWMVRITRLQLPTHCITIIIINYSGTCVTSQVRSSVQTIVCTSLKKLINSSQKV